MQFLSRVVHHLVPTKHNGHVPHILQAWSLWVILGIGIVFFSFAEISERTGHFGQLAEVYPAVVVTLTNKDRAAASLSPLTVNPTLAAAAQMKANDMARLGYFAHTSPEGLTPWHWFREAGYTFLYAGENLAVNFEDSENVQTAWLNSPTHRANIMNGNFTEIGIATARGMYNGTETTFVVEMFGKPAVVQAAARVVEPPAPTSSPTAAPSEKNTAVAGEAVKVKTVKVLKQENNTQAQTPTTFLMIENTDPALAAAEPVVTETVKVAWYKKLAVESSSVAGTMITLLIIMLLVATGGVLIREYERHHIKHMTYGFMVIIVLCSTLMIGRLGVFSDTRPIALAPIEVTQ